ncbi:endonuclease/exonuclease/phosphatase family protein [Actinomadura scrupuli]|uniref:endonuclease/exonuclease/phosphatase family protein n=1 Tax=Actinomadura scrupuli TaxID=559629 RepID=UPI003D973FBA
MTYARLRRRGPGRLLCGCLAAGLTVVLLPGTGDAAPVPVAPRIHDIQGAAQLSPLAGQQVGQVPGVVTAVTANGFWAQDPRPDHDDATSEGIFVFTRTRPSAVPSDSVLIDGVVAEFRPGGDTSANLTRTELDASAVTVVAHGVPLPPAVVVGPHGRRPPGTVIEDDATGDVEISGTFDPGKDGIDFYESLESMRVVVDDAVVVGPRTQFGEVPVLPERGAGATVRSRRGGLVLRPGDADPERLIVDDTLVSVPAVNVGDRFAGRSTGVLDYAFGGFKLFLTATPQVVTGPIARESARPARAGELALATANMANLDPSDPPAKFQGLAQEIVGGLGSPDVLALEEVQDNSGPDDDGTVAADQTVAQLVTAISAAGGPAYDWRSIPPQNNADGGEPGGNIRVGFLFRTDRGLSFVDRPGGDAATPVTAVDDGTGRARLSVSPGRVDPLGPAWANSRKPLAGEFSWHGVRVIVVAGHWNSRGGDDPLFGRYQPPRLPSQVQRQAQAEAMAGFVNSIRAVDPRARVIVAGDLNDFEFSAPLKTLTTGTGLSDLAAGLPVDDRYTYDHEGNSQVLDHILLSPELTRQRYVYDIVHMNAEFADQISDHDPSVVRLRLG